MTDTGPLAGMTVLELGTAITAPYVALLLADLGADVVKIEPPTGDPFRVWDDDRPSPRFVAFNRNKKSVVLDLRSDDGQATLHDLAAGADVFVSNYRPAALARLAADHATVMGLNARLVYCEITGAGPEVTRPMYDAVAQGLCGLMSMTSGRDDPRPRGPALSDSITGALAAVAVCGALVERERTGRGRLIRTSMLESCLSFFAESVMTFLATGESPTPFTRARHSQSYGFVCADDQPLVIHLSTPTKFWDGLVAAVERPDLASDPRFATYGDRVEHYDQLSDELASVFRRAPAKEWLARLDAADVPAAPVNDLGQALADPLIEQLAITPSISLDGRALPVVRRPWNLDGAPAYTAPPELGAHNESVLASLERHVRDA